MVCLVQVRAHVPVQMPMQVQMQMQMQMRALQRHSRVRCTVSQELPLLLRAKEMSAALRLWCKSWEFAVQNFESAVLSPTYRVGRIESAVLSLPY